MAPDINISALINEVKEKSVLYDISTSGYRDKDLKRKVWDQVCCNVFSPPVWNSMQSKDKAINRKEILTKWNSLRSCFKREVNVRRNPHLGRNGRKKRKYIYYDSLKFLLPFVEKTKKSESMDSSIKLEGSEHSECNDEQSSDQEFSTGLRSSPIEQAIGPSESFDGGMAQTWVENLVPCHKNGKTGMGTAQTDLDGDESFFKSLLPSLKGLTADQKLQLRIELLKTILEFKQSLNS